MSQEEEGRAVSTLFSLNLLVCRPHSASRDLPRGAGASQFSQVSPFPGTKVGRMGKGAENKGHRGAAFWGQRPQPCGCEPGHTGPPCRRDSAPGTAHSGTSARRTEGPGCVFPRAGHGVRHGALPRWAELDAWREKRKYLAPCRAVNAGLCCVKAMGGSFCTASQQSPFPFAKTGLRVLRLLSVDVLYQT